MTCQARRQDSSDDEGRKKRKAEKKPSREVRTKKVALKEVKNKREDLDEVAELARKLHNINVADVNYAACFTKLTTIAPAIHCHDAAPSNLDTIPRACTYTNDLPALIGCSGPAV